MDRSKKESGTELLARLANKSSLVGLEKVLFPGDLEPRQVVELVGDSGSGKTQYLIHVLATAVMPSTLNGINLGGLDVDVLFIDTSCCFNIVRLVGILEQRLTPALSVVTDTSSSSSAADTVESASTVSPGGQYDASTDPVEQHVRRCLSKLYIVRCSTSAQLAVTLCSLETVLAARCSIRLVLVDDVVAYSERDRFMSTESHFRHCTRLLARLVQNHGLVVMATRCTQTARRRGLKRDASGREKRSEDDVEYLKCWRHLVTDRRTFGRRDDAANVFVVRSDNEADRMFTVTETGVSFTDAVGSA